MSKFGKWGAGSWTLVLLGVLSGCAFQGQVKSNDLPVRRVVVYRNGVAYFERSGDVKEERVQFQLRQENVGDFLATLAVMERGGSSVRAASFPVSLEDESADPDDPRLAHALSAWEGKKTDSRVLRRVTLELDGERHHLTVGYLAETPLWRPSYRLIIEDGGKAVLQAWGIVQNQSGEDWRNVEIALVAGAPIAFESTLGDPVIPPRPVVTDEGEIIAGVPEGTTTYREQQEYDDDKAGEGEAAPAMDAAEEMSQPESNDQGPGMSRPPAAARGAVASQQKMETPVAPPEPVSMVPSDPSRLARVELQSGATRYEVPHRITVPDKSATMVLLVSKRVSGETVFLYAPDPGVNESYVHPFRVARFRNESGGLLERGPIAVFETGAFLGQGLVESLPADARATVPFALMRSMSIRREVTYDQRGARLYAVRQGEMTIEIDQATLSTYKIQNGDAERAKLLVRHQRLHGAELWEPPEGTEDLAQNQAVLAPVEVPGHGKATLTVEERLPTRRIADFRSVEARAAIRDYLKDPRVPSEQRQALEEVLKHAAQLATMDDQELPLVREQRELERSTKETRASLRAIEDNKQAGALRSELTARLAEGTKRLEELTKDLVELRLRRTEQEVRLKQAREGLSILPPDRR